MISAVKPQLYVIVAVCMLAPLISVAQNWQGGKHGRFVSFEVPESKATYPLSINEARTVTGYYIDKAGVTRGFVRREDGDITTFSIPGSVSTKPVSINSAGDIVGYYELATGTDVLPQVPQGFIRDASGDITTFGNTLNTDSSGSFWAQPAGINVGGEVVGNYPDIALASVAFVRSPTGIVTGFSLSLGASYSTIATAINAAGAVVGYDSSGPIDQAQGFLWDGQSPINPVEGYTQISVLNSTGTFPTGINAEGTVVGCYSVSGIYQDFMYASDGVITSLKLPGTIPSCLANFADVYSVVPQPVVVNDQGTITGWYTNAEKVSRGFVRFEDGKLHTFAHHDSKQTIPTSINNCDVITGYYSRGSETVGFIREP
jgi:hypothetical protein